MPADDPLRILDASLNRTAEGLRVVEDYARFVLDDAHLSRMVKELRHDLTAASSAVSVADRHAMRDTSGDVGTAIATSSEAVRIDPWHVCRANCERVKQSLRSLEEFGKALSGEAAHIPLPRRAGPVEGCKAPGDSPPFSVQVEQLRYRFYAIESALTRTAEAIDCMADARLYVLVDARASEAEFTAIVEELVAAGVGAIQLRHKQLADAELLARAKILHGICGGRTLSIINDRPDIAAAAGADGVHLGQQDDLPVADARRVLGPRKLIGASTHSIQQARAAVLAGANYLGAGPTFPSATKSFAEFPGLDFLRQVAAEIALPTFAIGGINATNIDEVLKTGICRIAVSAAVTASPSPGVAAQELLDRIDRESPI